MVVLMDYACPTCGDVPQARESCTTCKASGGVRLPAGTIVKPDTHTELVLHRGDVFAKIDVVDGIPYVNGVRVNISLDNVIAIIEAIGCEYAVEEFDPYEVTDCVDFIEESHD